MIEQIKSKINKILSFDKENSEKLSQSIMTHTEHSQLILEVLEEDVPYLIGEMEATKGNALLWRDKAAIHQRQVEEMQKAIKMIDEIVFANESVPKNVRERIQRVIHYTLPKSIQGGNTHANT